MLFPDEEYKSAYDIPYENYYAKGYRGIIFDIDNTLVMHNAHSDDKSDELIKRLTDIGYKVGIVSNNHEPRVKSFANESGIDNYVFYAWKPKPDGYEEVMHMMGTDPSNTLFVGDQIFTDILGANRAGLHSILVGKLGPDPEIQIVLKRALEAPIILTYHIFGKRKT